MSKPTLYRQAPPKQGPLCFWLAEIHISTLFYLRVNLVSKNLQNNSLEIFFVKLGSSYRSLLSGEGGLYLKPTLYLSETLNNEKKIPWFLIPKNPIRKPLLSLRSCLIWISKCIFITKVAVKMISPGNLPFFISTNGVTATVILITFRSSSRLRNF